ncbi:MAG: CBS domain-containing protein [Nitrospirae bacterium]|nr:CBS domain-containing protein [Nitrospirota bacterium]
MRVSEIMRKCNPTSKETSIREAERLFKLHGVKILPVTNGNKLIGVVTRGDIARALPSDATTLSKWEIGYWLDEIKVTEFMKKPVTVSPDIELFEIVEVARDKGFYNFPVVENGSLLGMIYEEDIFKALADEAKRPAIRIEVNVKGQRSSFLKRLGIGGLS